MTVCIFDTEMGTGGGGGGGGGGGLQIFGCIYSRAVVY